ncbi:MAG: histidine kinase [Marinilabiliales bacterium]|nr:histidine kinase [Marinilabiliales bacterium]
MNPHFIFNALNAIKDLAGQKDEILLDQYIDNFGKLTRNILYNSVKENITLQEELEIVKHYLEVEYRRS